MGVVAILLWNDASAKSFEKLCSAVFSPGTTFETSGDSEISEGTEINSRLARKNLTVVVWSVYPSGINQTGSDGFFRLLGQNRKNSWAYQKGSDGYIPFYSKGVHRLHNYDKVFPCKS